MNWKELFQNGALLPIKNLVSKIVYNGFNAPFNEINEGIINFASTLIVLFLLYKLVWLVWQSIKFIIGCLEW